MANLGALQHGGRLLVVDDQPEILALMEEILTSEGFEVAGRVRNLVRIKRLRDELDSSEGRWDARVFVALERELSGRSSGDER